MAHRLLSGALVDRALMEAGVVPDSMRVSRARLTFDPGSVLTLKLEIAVDAALLERLVRAFVLIGETPPENWILEKRDG